MAKQADKKDATAGTGRQHWFDEQTHKPLIEEYARHMESFLEALADGKIDDAEIKAQEDRLVALMQEVEPQLDDALHARVTRLLCELTAYDLMHMMHTMQQARPKTTFRG